ncbi:MAG: hypothetical protein DRQ39_08840, partial [Gammaproteobacteria bacterium]
MNYVELTNMGDSALDLSNFALENYKTSQEYWILEDRAFHLRLNGTLAPGASYLISGVLEGLSAEGLKVYRPKLAAISDRTIYPLETLPVEIHDSISAEGFQILTLWAAKGPYAIRYYTPAGDSIIIDAVNHSMTDDDFKWDGLLSVAGVPEAALTHVLVRKFSIKQGVPLGLHESNWDAARGTDINDSEWMPILHNEIDPVGNIFRTPGNHGDFHIDVQSANPDLTIDIDAPSMTVPWGIVRGDYIIDELTLGDGMAWLYIEKPSLKDSVHNICQTGDYLTLYACGNVLEQKDFALNVSDPAVDMAEVFPLSYKEFPDPADPEGIWLTPHYVTEEMPVIDTIGNVLFATRIDSLYKYLEKAPDATWEII